MEHLESALSWASSLPIFGQVALGIVLVPIGLFTLGFIWFAAQAMLEQMIS